MSLSGNKMTAGVKLLLLGLLFLAATTLSAQTSKNVNLPGTSIRLSELFREIERQTNSVVVFNVENTDVEKVVTLSRPNGTIVQVLDQALDGSGYSYRINGRYVIVLSEEEKETAPLQTYMPPQPTQAEFERDINDYADRNLSGINYPQTTRTVRYDTVRTTISHDGIFHYPERSYRPVVTDRLIRTPYSQDTPPLIAVKTNLVWAATLTPNLAAEVGLGHRTSLEISGGNNRWNLKGSTDDNKKLVHWVIKPEFRYWLCERFNGHFFGVHAFYGKYNVSDYDIPMLFDKEYRYEGDAYGGGLSYGYHFALSRRWGLEFTAGVGVAQLDYVKKDCEKCGSEVGNFNKTYFGPTSLGIKLIFVIK